MRQIKLLALAFMAVLSLTGAMAALASAEATLPNVLPEGTAVAPLTATTTCGKSTFGNGVIKVESVKCKGSQAGNSKKLGTFDTLFEETTLVGEACTGLNDTKAGSVLATGTFHIRHYNEGTKLKTAAIFLLKEIHFECGSLEPVLLSVKGCVAAELTPNEEKLVTEQTLNFTTKEGDNVPVKVLNEENTGEENCELLSKEGAGLFKLSTQLTTVKVKEFKKSGSAVTVLVMPL